MRILQGAEMSDGNKKRGRPATGETRAEMKFVAFKLDRETQAALDKLVDEQRAMLPMGHSARGLQSAAIRRAILIAAGKIEVS